MPQKNLQSEKSMPQPKLFLFFIFLGLNIFSLAISRACSVVSSDWVSRFQVLCGEVGAAGFAECSVQQYSSGINLDSLVSRFLFYPLFFFFFVLFCFRN